MRLWMLLLGMFVFANSFAAPQPAPTPLPLKLLRLPRGFTVEVYAYPVPGARTLSLGDKALFLSVHVKMAKSLLSFPMPALPPTPA